MRETRHIVPVVLLAVLIAGGLVWLSSPESPSPATSVESPSTAGGGQPAAREPVAPVPEDTKSVGPEAARRAGSDAPSTQPDGELLVWGAVETEYGEVAPGESIELSSASRQRRYTAVSDGQGEFMFENVVPAADYQVKVSPQGTYKRYRRRGLRIDADNTRLDVVLEALGTGVLQGEIVDPQGHPIPDFAIWVQSLSRDRGIRRTRSDSVGAFRIEGFPEGPFEVLARGVLLRIDGMVFEPAANEHFALVVDHGNHSLSGRVFDHHGQPVDGATVVVSWAYSRGDMESVVERRTLTDADGAFLVEELAYGEHQLVISLGNGAALKRNVTVGEAPADMVLYLEERGSG